MQKIRNLTWKWLAAFSLPVIFFIYCSLPVHAEESAAFTHTHANSCYRSETESCNSSHFSNYYEEYQTRYCSQCAKGTTHKLGAHTYTCLKQNDCWRPDGTCVCTECGYTTTWATTPCKSHTYTVQKRVCGMEEGEETVRLSVSADTASWTNQKVLLTASLTQIKDDASGKNISLNWPDGKLSVTANGTYSVTATNSLGNSIEASYTVNCIDTAPPVISGVTGDTGSMSKTAITVNVAASDGESGLADAPFSIDGGSSFGAGSSFTVTEGSPVTFVVKDKAGNTAQKTIKRSDFPYPKEEPKNDNGGGNTGNASGNTSGSATGNTSGSTTGSGTGTATGNASAGKPGSTEGNSTGMSSGSTNQASDTGEKKNSTKNTDIKDKEKDTEKNSIKKDTGKKESGVKTENTQDAGEESENENSPKMLTIARLERERLLAQADRMQEDRLAAVTDDTKDTENMESVEENTDTRMDFLHHMWYFLRKNAVAAVVTAVILAAVLSGLIFFSYYSVVVYGYDGGDSYQRMGILLLKKEGGEYALHLPEEMTDSVKTLRFRLVLKERLVRKCGKKKLTIQSGDRKISQSMEECMDFVL